jgi:hypothetical protein
LKLNLQGPVGMESTVSVTSPFHIAYIPNQKPQNGSKRYASLLSKENSPVLDATA